MTNEPITDGKKKSRVVADGEVVSVDLLMMDALSQAVAGQTYVLSAGGPYPVRTMAMTDAERADRTTRQQEYETRVTDAWKNPPPVVPAAAVATPPATMSRAMHDAALTEQWRTPR